MSNNASQENLMPLIQDDERALATVETITALCPIDGADSIVTTPIRGWNVVVRTDEVAIGDRVVYFEIDTALPLADPRYAFLEPRGSRDVDGRMFHILRTAKLRGVYSQGLVLPLDQFSDQIRVWQAERLAEVGMETYGACISDGMDVTAPLNLAKYEQAIPGGGEGLESGPFLRAYAEKTTTERVQNLGSEWSAILQHPWVATEKIDGTSCTIVRDEHGCLHVCGRNWEIRNGDNLYWRTVLGSITGSDMLDGDVIQAEIAGPGIIPGNRLGLADVRLFVFNYIRNRQHLPRDQWPQWALNQATPIHDLPFPASPAEAVDQVNELKSLVTPGRLAEGIVWHTADGTVVPELGKPTFKTVSDAYLAKAAA